MPHVDFGAFSSVNVAKGRAELLPDPVCITWCIKEGLHWTPPNSVWGYKTCLENTGRRAKGKESNRHSFQRNQPLQVHWEHKDHCLDSRERVTTAEEGKGDLHCTNSVRKGAWDHREPSCMVPSTISLYVPSSLLRTAGCPVLLVSWINHGPKSAPKMPINSVIYCHPRYGLHQMNINAFTTMVEHF